LTGGASTIPQTDASSRDAGSAIDVAAAMSDSQRERHGNTRHAQGGKRGGQARKDRLPLTQGSEGSIPEAIERLWIEREQFDNPRRVQACLIRMKGRPALPLPEHFFFSLLRWSV